MRTTAIAFLVASLIWLPVVVTRFVVPAYAASEPVPACPLVATADTIEIYRCIDEETGFEFYVNNLGFMFAGP